MAKQHLYVYPTQWSPMEMQSSKNLKGMFIWTTFEMHQVFKKVDFSHEENQPYPTLVGLRWNVHFPRERKYIENVHLIQVTIFYKYVAIHKIRCFFYNCLPMLNFIWQIYKRFIYEGIARSSWKSLIKWKQYAAYLLNFHTIIIR